MSVFADTRTVHRGIKHAKTYSNTDTYVMAADCMDRFRFASN